MTKTEQNETKKRTTEWLDERWKIATRDDAEPQDMSFYHGAIKCCEFLGYEWRRDENGKHSLYIR